MDPELLSEERTELLEPLVRTFEEELLLEPLPLTRTFEEELLLPEERLDCPVEELERLVLLVLPVERRSSCWKEEDPELLRDWAYEDAGMRAKAAASAATEANLMTFFISQCICLVF